MQAQRQTDLLRKSPRHSQKLLGVLSLKTIFRHRWVFQKTQPDLEIRGPAHVSLKTSLRDDSKTEEMTFQCQSRKQGATESKSPNPQWRCCPSGTPLPSLCPALWSLQKMGYKGLQVFPLLSKKLRVQPTSISGPISGGCPPPEDTLEEKKPLSQVRVLRSLHEEQRLAEDR